MDEIDPAFFDKDFNVQRYLLWHVVGAASPALRQEQLNKVQHFRKLADAEIADVIDDNYGNFNASISRFSALAHRLEGTREDIKTIHAKANEAKSCLYAKPSGIASHHQRKRQSEEAVDFIGHLHLVLEAPEKVTRLVAEKQYDTAAEVFTKAFEVACSSSFAAVEETMIAREKLIESKHVLQTAIVEELHHFIYLKEILEEKSKSPSIATLEMELRTELLEDNLVEDSTDEVAGADSRDSRRHLVNLLDIIRVLQCEAVVLGDIKSMADSELDRLDTCLQQRVSDDFIKLKHSTTSAEKFAGQFGWHEHSERYAIYMRLLTTALIRVTQRHKLLSAMFHSMGDQEEYMFSRFVQKSVNICERSMTKFVTNEGNTTSKVDESASKLTEENVHKFELWKQLRRSRHHTKHKDRPSSPIKKAAAVRPFCSLSLYHLPSIVQQVKVFIDALFRETEGESRTVATGFASTFEMLLRFNWLPKLKDKAQTSLLSVPRYDPFQLSTPKPFLFKAEEAYRPLLEIIDRMALMATEMQDYGSDLSTVVEVVTIKWISLCESVTKNLFITKQAANPNVMEALADVNEMLLATELFQNAKGNVPEPSSPVRNMPWASPKKPHIHANSSICLDDVNAKEIDLYHQTNEDEPALVSIDVASVAVLASVNKMCDHVAEFLHMQVQPMTKTSVSKQKLSQAISKCSSLADDCLCALRGDLRVRCADHISKLFGLPDSSVDNQLSGSDERTSRFKADLCAFERHVHASFDKDKAAVVFTGLDEFICGLLNLKLDKLLKKTMTQADVDEMQTIISDIHQVLTSVFFCHTKVDISNEAFQNVYKHAGSQKGQ